MSKESNAPPCVAVRRDDLTPICPHCDADLPEVYIRKSKGSFGVGRGMLFFCPQCRKVLGAGAQWYPFPG